MSFNFSRSRNSINSILPVAKGALPLSKILQFGTGRFLRGFFAPVIDDPRSIVVVQSRIQSSGASILNAHLPGSNNEYHVWTRGKQNGEVVDEFEVVRSLDRAVVAHEQWEELVKIATSDQLELIVSNTTEAGLTLESSDDAIADFTSQCPVSFPAKLTALLFVRFKAGLGGLTILPLELVEFNANRLQELVLEQTQKWQQTNTGEFNDWLRTENRWLNNLVDRIVTSVSDTPPWQNDDPLAVVGEPFRMLAIEDDKKDRTVLPDHPMIQWVDDLQRVFVRKVRILNGLHTAMVAHSLPQGFETVLDAITDPAERKWLDSLLQDEILPALSARGIEESDFAKDVIERFENPFFKHRLADIANGHAKKLTTRIQPTIDDFCKAFGREPEKLCEVLASR